MGWSVGSAAGMALGAAGRPGGSFEMGPVVSRDAARTHVPVGTVNGPVIHGARGPVTVVTFHGPFGPAGKRQQEHP